MSCEKLTGQLMKRCVHLKESDEDLDDLLGAPRQFDQLHGDLVANHIGRFLLHARNQLPLLQQLRRHRRRRRPQVIGLGAQNHHRLEKLLGRVRGPNLVVQHLVDAQLRQVVGVVDLESGLDTHLLVQRIGLGDQCIQTSRLLRERGAAICGDLLKLLVCGDRDATALDQRVVNEPLLREGAIRVELLDAPKRRVRLGGALRVLHRSHLREPLEEVLADLGDGRPVD
eukprot:1987298-Prymnesium_polylepis.1